MGNSPSDRTRKGRGATTSPDNRYAEWRREAEDDGWGILEETAPPLRTTVQPEASRRIITYNDSPDIPFDRSVNPYRGCEHGCIYCFARPSHAWLDLSPGLDFESRLFYKPEAAELLRQELGRGSYRPAPLALGINTDAYQPIERRLQVTRALLEVLHETRHPVSIVTKSALIERDLDLLGPMAAQGLVEVALSVTTLDPALARVMEPRAASPARRLQAIRRLSDAGVPVSVLVAPVVPVLNDAELEGVLAAVRQAGAVDAGYVVLRLPHELKELFTSWLEEHFPDRAAHVMARIRDLRGGRDYDPAFGKRLRGEGVYAQLIRQRFEGAYRRLGFPGTGELRCDHFRPPEQGGQLGLF
jgi:DNA repair photolyase